MGLLAKAKEFKQAEGRANLGKVVEYGNLIADLYDETKNREKTREERNHQKIYEKAFRYYAKNSPTGEFMGEKYLQAYKLGLK